MSGGAGERVGRGTVGSGGAAADGRRSRGGGRRAGAVVRALGRLPAWVAMGSPLVVGLAWGLAPSASAAARPSGPTAPLERAPTRQEPDREDPGRVARAGRVVAVEGPRRCVVDLGAEDGVAAMDPVEIVLVEGGTARGRVLSVEAERATVVLSGRAVELGLGLAVRVQVVGVEAERGESGPDAAHGGDGAPAGVPAGSGDGADPATAGAGAGPAGGPAAAEVATVAGAPGSLDPGSVAPVDGPNVADPRGGSQVPAAPEDGGPADGGQDGRPPVRLAGRVLSVLGPRRFGIDRGGVDGVAPGDRVRLLPIDGPPLDGRVDSVTERSAEVLLVGANAEPRPGMRVEVVVPAERLDRPEAGSVAPRAAAPRTDGAAAAVAEGNGDAEGRRWSNTDDGWREGMPLLAGIEAVRPIDRRPEWGGRLYAISDTTLTTEDGRSAQFHRLGLGLWGENFLGRGERLQLDAEWNREFQNLPDQPDERQNRLRVDRFSYLTGGTRFEDTRLELGRFLHSGLPELGVIDGVEWIRRLDNGDSFGVSLGYLPEPNEEFESGEDLSVSAHYRWVADQSEVFAATFGAQKTWHNFEADRDLLVLRYDYLPTAGWSSTGSALVDHYSDSDDEAGRSFGLTQAWLTARRSWGSAWGLDLRYRHFEFPTLLRNEFQLEDPAQFEPAVQDLLIATQTALLADARRDRVSADAWARLLPLIELRAGVGGWLDEDDQGGDARLGFEISRDEDRGSRVFVEAFGVDGRFTSVLGGRAGVGVQGNSQRVDLFYEVANQDQRGFDDDNDDFLQHRARVAWSYDSPSGFSLSTYLDGVDFQTEAGITIGVFAQWIF